MFYTFSLCWTNVGYKVLQLYTHDSTHDRSYHIMDKIGSQYVRIGDKYLGKSPKNKPSPPFGGLEPLTTVLQLSNRPNHPSHEWPWLGIETHGDLGIHQAFRTPYSYLFFPMIWLRKHEKKTSHVHVWWPRTSSWPLALDLLCSMGRWAVRPNTVRPKRLGESGKVW